jgi:cullin 3
MNETELELVMDKIIQLFRHIQSKDMFEEFYMYHLSRRLLHKKSASDDAERRMIGKLRSECGNQYTLKLETMMKDINASQETMEKYQAECPSASTFELDIKVLTQGNWPIDGRVSLCNLPEELDDPKHTFTDFYMKLHNGRILNCKLNM